MEIAIYIITILIVIFYQKIYKRSINSFNAIMLPYVVILLINNHIATKFYFKEINSDTQWMIFLGIIFFFIGSVFCILTISNRFKKNNNKEINTNKILVEKTVPYVIIVLLIRSAQLLKYYFNYGLHGMIENDFKMFVSRGPVSHLMLSVFPLMMLYFYHWLKNKKDKKYLILFLIYAIYSFIETEKAQIISLVLSTYIYCSLKDKKYFKRGLFLIFPLIGIVFITNYASKFILQGFVENVEGTYYVYRLWTYIAGGIINSNLITSSSSQVITNGFDYIWDIIFAFPDMIINKFFGIKMGGQVAENLPYLSSFPSVTTISSGFEAQEGNVVSTMTMAYGNGNILAFGIFSILWGFISECIFLNIHFNNNDRKNIFFCCYITFSILSFFGSYYTTTSFMERFIWCFIIGIVFNNNFKIKYNNKHVNYKINGDLDDG